MAPSSCGPGAELKLPVSPSMTLNPNMVLELSVKVEKLPEQQVTQAAPPPGPAVPPTGGMDFKGIHIESDPSRVPLPEWQPPKPPENITDLQGLFMEGGGTVTPLPALPDVADYQKLQIPIGELGSTIDAIGLRNRNTYRIIDVKDISIFDKTQRGGYVPAEVPLPGR